MDIVLAETGFLCLSQTSSFPVFSFPSSKDRSDVTLEMLACLAVRRSVVTIKSILGTTCAVRMRRMDQSGGRQPNLDQARKRNGDRRTDRPTDKADYRDAGAYSSQHLKIKWYLDMFSVSGSTFSSSSVSSSFIFF